MINTHQMVTVVWLASYRLVAFVAALMGDDEPCEVGLFFLPCLSEVGD